MIKMLSDDQQKALTLLTWLESEEPSADDMDLGLTMISLMLTSKLHEDEEDSLNEKRYKGGTLLVCSAHLLPQWHQEVIRHLKPKFMDVKLYHGHKRKARLKRFMITDTIEEKIKLPQDHK